MRKKNLCRRSLLMILTILLIGSGCSSGSDGGPDNSVAGDLSSDGSREADLTTDSMNPDVPASDTLQDLLVQDPDTLADTLMDAGEDTMLTDSLTDLVEDLPEDTFEDTVEDVEVWTGPFKVRGTVEQIYIWLADPEVEIEVLGPEGSLVAEGVTDYQGSLVIRLLPPGEGYTVRLKNDPEVFIDEITVMSIEGSKPSQEFYSSQVLEPGYGYITMRDGTRLSYFMVLPGPVEEGPYPMLVNYSGYSPSRPGESLGGMAEAFCGQFPVLCNAPNFPSGLIASLMGFAVIGVNVRGTGCSGGAYDYFEPLQLLDGYDVVETVAAQSFVKFHKVGMIGISYPGICQLFVASTRPPSLAAIAPMSVLADTYTSTLIPGGIYNVGFAMEWIDMVLDKALPYAHGWIHDVVNGGDAICEEHQLLHSQQLDAIQKALDNPFYTDEVAGPVDPTTFVGVIDVPVFLTGQFQDEQTGPHFPALFDKFTSSPLTRFTISNGIHMDGFSPQILGEWNNFLSFYVAREIPAFDPTLVAIAPVFMLDIFEDDLSLPANRFEDYDDFDEALAVYEAEPRLRIIWESGANPDVEPGAPQGTFETFYDEWPIPTTQVARFYLQPQGALSTELPGPDGGASSWEPDPDSGNGLTLASGSVEHIQPNWDYRQLIPGKALSFLTEPLTQDLVMAGHGSVDLWLKSTGTDADLEVCITEVRPDGLESYIQCGWLRASKRALRDDSTELRPIPTFREEDLQPLVPGEWTPVRVELMPFQQIFRAGSRLRISIDTPGDSMARWRFMLLDWAGELPIHTIGHDQDHPSSIALPLLPEVEVNTPLPPCHALRGQPCRDYVPYTNLSPEDLLPDGDL